MEILSLARMAQRLRVPPKWLRERADNGCIPCLRPTGKRYLFNPVAVQEALAHPRLIDQHLRRAQEARRVLDRLFGYDLSGLVWKKVRYGLSAAGV